MFDGKVVIVTGGSGIGQAACHLYAYGDSDASLVKDFVSGYMTFP